MKYMGLDIATATGWSFFEDDRLLERGTIRLIAGMELPQKLHYFHLELNRLVTRLQPDYCFIEDVILGISGAKTLAFLARLNGVAINTVFSILQERTKLYEPTYWKANSYDGLNGQAKKWQIQLAVIRHYNIPITGDFDSILSEIESEKILIDNKKDESRDVRVLINKLKAEIVRKRNPCTSDEKICKKARIKELEVICKAAKDDAKLLQKEFDKRRIRTSNDIAAQTGITEDISDSCGVAYCGYKELSNV